MRNRLENAEYSEDVRRVSACGLPWDKLQNKTFLVTGATGMLGTFLIDVLMYKNHSSHLHCQIRAMGRSGKRGEERFSAYAQDPDFLFLVHDINEPIAEDFGDMNYAVHLASNTHPRAYAEDPIGTITANVFGTKYLLDYCSTHHCERFALASSNEIYGENRGDTELFAEDYCGYINSNTLRAGYPESKRCGVALCQAYRRQKHMDIVIPRFTRSYGPTMKTDDSKALSQFIRNAVNRENIVLKSAGNQYYSYTYAADAVSGFLYVLLKGSDGEAYNIADPSGDIRLKDLAAILAEEAGTEVVFAMPDETEKAGFSKATKARLDGTKLRALGWKSMYDMHEGIHRTLTVLEDISCQE